MIAKKIAIPAFIFLCLAQLYVSGGMILRNEAVIRTGEVINLRTAPIDPSDPLRGKYITLNFSDIYLTVPDASLWQYNDVAYLTFRIDTAGFHIPSQLSSTIPPASGTYLAVKIQSIINTQDEQAVYFDYPFDRFYLEESKAPQAEEKYREALTDPSVVTYARIYVQEGKGVVDNVYIGERSIIDVFD
ncbi:MAG: GDYXXLXY domain-containing protein [Saprospiraceae bacterium]|nr:GDYXXLXY domain-containing protein [Saprospiraceae bacterium]